MLQLIIIWDECKKIVRNFTGNRKMSNILAIVVGYKYHRKLHLEYVILWWLSKATDVNVKHTHSHTHGSLRIIVWWWKEMYPDTTRRLVFVTVILTSLVRHATSNDVSVLSSDYDKKSWNSLVRFFQVSFNQWIVENEGRYLDWTWCWLS